MPNFTPGPVNPSEIPPPPLAPSIPDIDPPNGPMIDPADPLFPTPGDPDVIDPQEPAPSWPDEPQRRPDPIRDPQRGPGWER